jgi:creatinine amidohydrolase
MIELFSLPHEEMTALVRNGYPVYVFVNPIEYHGPHLSLYNDGLISWGLAKRLHRRLEEEKGPHPFIVGNNITCGSDPAPGPGSAHIKYRLLKELVLKLSKSLTKIGAKRVIFMTFHGSPFHNCAIQSGVDYLRRNGIKAIATFNIVLREMLYYNKEEHQDLASLISDTTLRDEIMDNLTADFHAGFFESSISMYLAPDSVSKNIKDVPPCPKLIPQNMPLKLSKLVKALGFKDTAQELMYAAYVQEWLKIKPFPGYSGFPAVSSTEVGEYFVDKNIMPLYESSCLDVLWGDKLSPDPIMKWVIPLSLGGRIPL